MAIPKRVSDRLVAGIKRYQPIIAAAVIIVSSVHSFAQQDQRGAKYYETNPAKWDGKSITLYVLSSKPTGQLSDDKQSTIFSLETVQGRIYAFIPNSAVDNFSRRMAAKAGKKTVQGKFIANGFAGPAIILNQ